MIPNFLKLLKPTNIWRVIFKKGLKCQKSINRIKLVESETDLFTTWSLSLDQIVKILKVLKVLESLESLESLKCPESHQSQQFKNRHLDCQESRDRLKNNDSALLFKQIWFLSMSRNLNFNWYGLDKRDHQSCLIILSIALSTQSNMTLTEILISKLKLFFFNFSYIRRHLMGSLWARL